MKHLLGKISSVFIVAGISSLVSGIAIISWPEISVSVLACLLAIPLIIQGIVQLTSALNQKNYEEDWWLVLLQGFVNLSGGLFAISYPGITMLFLALAVGITWIASGLILIYLALCLRREIQHEIWLFLSGMISVGAGLFVCLNLETSLLWFIALYAVLSGIFLLLFGFKAKTWTIRYFDDIME